MSKPQSKFYTDAEIASIRQHLRDANKAAKAVVEARGHKMHPRIAAMRESPLKRDGQS